MRKIVLSVFTVLLLCFQVVAQNQRVSGTVTDPSGETVIGATVQLKGTNVAVATNIDGQYSISAPANGVLIFSSVGSVEQEHAIGGRTVIDVVLQPSTESIETLVFIGYGSGSEITSVVGSHTSVGGAELASKPSPNVADAMQGKVAGMQSWISSGEPTATANIRVRGVSSINLSSDPLYILDGMPVSASVFNSLNAYDIENVTVLKDAASTAIYGSRAANGVVYITSKKGRRSAAPTLSINAYYGISFKTNSPLRLMNAKELLQFEDRVFPEQAQSADGQRIRYLVDEYGLGFNWENYIMDSAAPNYNLNAEVSGGSDNVRYLFSFGYFNKKGTNIRSAMDRYNFRANVDADVAKNFRVGTSVALSVLWQETSVTGWYTNTPTGSIYSELPYTPPYAYEVIDGKLYYGKRFDKITSNKLYPWGSFDQFFFFENQFNEVRTLNLNGSLYEDWRPIKGLTVKAVQSIDGRDLLQEAMMLPNFDGTSTSAMKNFYRTYTLTATNTIDYKHTFGENHNIGLLLGQEAIIGDYVRFSGSTSGFVDDRLMTLPNGGVGLATLTEDNWEYVFNSYFLQLDYNFANKYYLSGTVRRDGSSRFGPENRWGTFYSVGGMWDVKREKFLENVKAIDMLRFRVNYGETGNANLGNYQWRGAMTSSAANSYDGTNGMYISTPGNQALSWETIAALGASMTIGLFDKVDFTFDWYNKTTLDMLMQEPMSAATGFSSGWKNVGSMRNRGIEMDLSVDLVSTKDFYWGVNANASYNKNTILELTSDFLSGELIFKEGGSYGQFNMVERVGVDPYDGRLIWRTPDNELTKIYSDDYRQPIEGLNFIADWSGGFGTALSWKDLSLNIDFVWCGPKYILINEFFYSRNTASGYRASNNEYWMMDMWTEPWQSTQVAKQGTSFVFDTSAFSNAAFLRLKNVTLAYTLPAKLMEKTNGVLKGARVYVTGRNLLTFTTFQGYDPEFDNPITQFEYPNSREVMFGLELTF